MSRSLIHSATQYLDERAKNGFLAAFADRVSTASTAAYYSVPSPTRTGFFPSSFRRPPTVVADLGHGDGCGHGERWRRIVGRDTE